MEKSKIRWCDSTWNVMTGCTHVSPGCDSCYAEALMTKGRLVGGFPNGFVPTFKPHKLRDPEKWKDPRRIFVNSLSDVHHEDFTLDEIDAVYDKMIEIDRHDYLVLTKRPQRMARYFLGRNDASLSTNEIADGTVDRGYLARRGLDAVPDNIWLGTSIESDTYAFRANYLRRIPCSTRFISAEPLVAAVPSLDLTGIHWLIVGGESGNGTKQFRPMDLEWAQELREKASDAECAFFFKQNSGVRTETGLDVLGERIEEWPRPHPTMRVSGGALFAVAES